ncbi:transcriptional regulator [Peribacillus saganii]|uniref:Transcriptional regulator n=1 Tax=Peribacillus saganii TaxID=2303992 RepID=A0A372LD88_9BACI|nr:competence protein ComK [Peribacillus saganii]RFU63541.1 transcriptional regulator [Peribacillus saganii]
MTTENQCLIEEYEITPYTLLLMPIQYGSKTYTRIYELNEEFISPFRPLDIIKKSCQYFGSSYEGRREGTKRLIKITHKAPIAIDPTSSIFFFPTISPSRPQCVWLAHEHISSYSRSGAAETSITFRNQKSINLPVSFSSFENQLLRTAHLKTTLVQRIAETERKSFYMFHRKKTEA